LQLQAGGVNKLNADRDRVTADMEQLTKSVCPTCQREWDEALTRLEDLKIELEQINGEAEELRFVQEEADRLKAEVDAMPRTLEPNPKIAAMRAALEKCEADMEVEEQKTSTASSEETQRIANELKAARNAREDLVNQSYHQAAQERDKVLAGIGNLKALAAGEKDKKIRAELVRQKLAEEVGAVRERLRQIEVAKVQVKSIQDQLGPLQVELARWSDYAHLTGREAFRGKFFDEALEAISAETNAILASIANTRNVTLEFSTEEETADGKAKNEIVPVLTINGRRKGRPSGGMRSAIELAVDLAVGRIISERTGVCPGWLILDESFDGLGPREKETCLEILQTHAHDRLVIVVDHASETQGLFTQKVTVQSSGGHSIIA
jgi:DNA repair exonuclease SbcCD ATPase subunit